MKVVAIVEPRRAAVVERPEPSASGDAVVVKVNAVAMADEYVAFQRGEVAESLGTGAAGEVVEADRAGRSRVGDRVVVMPYCACGRCYACRIGNHAFCNGTPDARRRASRSAHGASFAQYLLKPDWLLLPVPDGIPFAHAALACTVLGPAFTAFQRMRVGAGDVVLINGLDSIGLGAVVHAVHRGARTIACDASAQHRQIALELGADSVIDATLADLVDRVRNATSNGRVDHTVECTGSADGLWRAARVTRPLGNVAVLKSSPHTVFPDLVTQGLTLHGCRDFPLRDGPALMNMIARCGPSLDRLITHRFTLEQITDAWRVQASGTCGTVLLEPWAEEPVRESSKPPARSTTRARLKITLSARAKRARPSSLLHPSGATSS
jgi:L-iditol 2-dehydrogenase